MVLENYEIDGDNMIITKAELEKWRDHYYSVASEKGKGKIGWFYLGKHEVIIDILKMFEPLEG